MLTEEYTDVADDCCLISRLVAQNNRLTAAITKEVNGCRCGGTGKLRYWEMPPSGSPRLVPGKDNCPLCTDLREVLKG